MANITLRRAPWRSHLQPLFDRDPDFMPTSFRRMFDSMIEPTTESVGLFPAVEIAETPDEFVCTAELPGMEPHDIDLSFDDGVLLLKGEKKDLREKKEGKRYHVVERTYGAFQRTFAFPAKIEADKIQAHFVDGVLTIHIPKAAEAKTQTRKIDIK
ncbi:MAG TPA: Hsp20/alpha crystallin family protein [Gemmatimonadaceae bacterium]|nr:Hsp20/alpha crystallin family protein [Gemmatimonadaceae bacterium]